MREEIKWEQFGQTKFISKRSFLVKSWRILDEVGSWHRYRLCTTWDFSASKFTSTPAIARLVKDEQKRIGILITGKNTGWVKVGKRIGVFQSIYTSFNTINKKALQYLLSRIKCDLLEEGDLILGRETVDAFD
ncbi:MAG: hypothetical protein PHX21_13440 [bacterium]|nr:hypothetical protein [bacterium]